MVYAPEGQKTGPDRTFKHYSWGRFKSHPNFDLNFKKFPNSEIGVSSICRSWGSSWGRVGGRVGGLWTTLMRCFKQSMKAPEHWKKCRTWLENQDIPRAHTGFYNQCGKGLENQRCWYRQCMGSKRQCKAFTLNAAKRQGTRETFQVHTQCSTQKIYKKIAQFTLSDIGLEPNKFVHINLYTVMKNLCPWLPMYSGWGM